MSDAIAAALLAWYDRHARKLPWRVGPKDRARGVKPDPYRVWLSEIMLQQTTVAAVKPYFDAFLARWPTVADLAAAPKDDVMKAWAGLGYYARARNLKACAEAVARDHGGQFPQTDAELTALPGIGGYTAAAIAAIAFDEPATVVDANIERVIARLFAIATPLPAAKKEIRARQETLTPQRRAGDYAQAMMDLGAAICTPKKPACSLCPLSDACAARAEGRQEDYPVKAAKAERPTRTGVAFVAVRRRRGGAAAPPGGDGAPRRHGRSSGQSMDDGTGEAGRRGRAVPCKMAEVPGTVVHVFTHFRLELTVCRAGRAEIETRAGRHVVGGRPMRFPARRCRA